MADHGRRWQRSGWWPVVRSGVAVFAGTVVLLTAGTAHADAIRDRQWHLDFLDIAAAHEITRGEGVTVAVLDTGVDYRHPDLKGALLEGRTFRGGRGDGWEDANGHGTGMASLIAGRGHGSRHRNGALGIAPDAKILPVRTAADGLGSFRAIEQGLEWAADHGADIISISQAYPHMADLHDAVTYAMQKGAVVVAGAGNTTRGDRQVAAPAAYPGVVAVSGTDQEGDFAAESVSAPEVVLAAPATDVMAASLDGGYAAGTGTSNSAAVVAGVAALVMSRYPDLDAANVINRLIRTAEDRGPDGRDPQYGFGIVDPVAALTGDVPEVEANPLITPAASPSGGSRSPAGAAGPGIGPAGWALAAIGVLGAVALTVVGFVALRRRRRATALPGGAASHGQVRPPVPPPGQGPGGRWPGGR